MFSVAILAILIFSGIVPVTAGELFRWVDERGIVHFTDSLHNVPEPYRPKALRIKPSGSTPSQPPARPRVEKASVNLKMRGQSVLVPALLNGRTQVSFILDTGASYTIISQATAKSLGIPLRKNLPTVKFQTANGIISAPLVVLKSFDVGGARVDDLTVAVHDIFPDRSVAGLLGLNFLSHFRMDLDTQERILVLEKK